MTDTHRVVFLVAVVGVLFLTAGVGTVAGTTDSGSYTVQQQQQTGTITVNTGSSGDSVEAVNSNTGAIEDSGTTGPNGEAVLTVPANTPVDIVFNGTTVATEIRVVAGRNINVAIVIGGPAPDCSTVSYNGDGSEANPYEVGNVDQLQCIEEQGLDANYEVVSDIDASETDSWNGGDGFEPIGELNFRGDTEFNGTFDGADYTVSGLYIDRGSADDVGLFGGVGSGGRLENVSLENVNVSGGTAGGLVGNNGGNVTESYANGNVSGGFGVGGLVGYNRGNVTESYANGNVSGNDDVGGLVGFNSGGTVGESYATGDVFGDGNVGGLVGVQEAGTVRESYATGDVSADGVAVGGLVGGSGYVEESYATGDVSGDGNVGGLVGISGTVTESYATGSISGNDEVGGLVGSNDFFGNRGNVTDSYWDTQSTGQSTSAGNGTGLTTSEMTGSAATSNMAGFDFTDTWKTVTSPDDYPILAWQTQTAPSPPNFEVSIDSTNSPVTEGDTLTVTATVTNTGGQQDTQTITASASGLGSITRPVTLNGGESTTETVSIPTSPGDAGTFTITVETADDTATTTVTINPAGGGGLSPNNPFGDSSNNPVDRSTVIDRVVEWNLNGEIGGTSYTRSEIINFVVGWNLAS
jgi:hypothetical protein